jgi:hypothetical protein
MQGRPGECNILMLAFQSEAKKKSRAMEDFF